MKYPVFATQAGQAYKVSTVCRVMKVRRPVFYAWAERLKDPSTAELRRQDLSIQIREVFEESRLTKGSKSILAELALGRGVAVSLETVEKLMPIHGVVGVPARRKWRRKNNVATAEDLLNRSFDRGGFNHVWVTDIFQHPTREGVLYCAAVLDTNTRKIVGWRINSSQTSQLATYALDMASRHRQPTNMVIHSDHGSQFVS